MSYTPQERAARAVCARSISGFCYFVGGDLGCRVGRGVTPHWSECVATNDQLILSGCWDVGEHVLDSVKEKTE